MCCMLGVCDDGGEHKKKLEQNSITVHWNLIGWKLQLKKNSWIFMEIFWPGKCKNSSRMFAKKFSEPFFIHLWLIPKEKLFKCGWKTDLNLIKTCFEAFLFSFFQSFMKQNAHIKMREHEASCGWSRLVHIHLFEMLFMSDGGEWKRCGWKDMTKYETQNTEWRRKKVKCTLFNILHKPQVMQDCGENFKSARISAFLKRKKDFHWWWFLEGVWSLFKKVRKEK